jgi:hypothetical protein
MKTYLVFLAFVQAAVGAAVSRAAARTRDITLNVVNADLAPDGVTRSRYSFLFGKTKHTHLVAQVLLLRTVNTLALPSWPKRVTLSASL